MDTTVRHSGTPQATLQCHDGFETWATGGCKPSESKLNPGCTQADVGGDIDDSHVIKGCLKRQGNPLSRRSANLSADTDRDRTYYVREFCRAGPARTSRCADFERSGVQLRLLGPACHGEKYPVHSLGPARPIHCHAVQPIDSFSICSPPFRPY